ncbi:hypothetical protein ACFLQ2_02865 [archaeon]
MPEIIEEKKVLCASCQKQKVPAMRVGDHLSVCHDCKNTVKALEEAIKNSELILPRPVRPEDLEAGQKGAEPFTDKEKAAINEEWDARNAFVKSLEGRIKVLRKIEEIKAKSRAKKEAAEDDALLKQLGVKEKLRAIEELEEEKKKK